MKRILEIIDNNILKWGVFLSVLFIPLYPKLPSVHINHVWVYIRLEDFLIGVLSIIWLIQILRKRVKFYWPLSIPIIIYWICGLFSFLNSLYLASSIPNFFVSIAFLSYGRHFEYMILFPIGFSAIKTKEDIKEFIIILSITTFGIILYGFGQKYYLYLWAAFPKFFEKYSFCFPSFQTGNEQFAKGLALCLPSDARVTSTFGGHYDLAAFMVMVAPIFGALSIYAKKFYQKIIYFLLFSGSLILLIFTSSRISYVAYLIGFAFVFIFLKNKKWIIPFTIISIILLLVFSSSTAKRFLETIRLTSVVTNSQGQVVGVTASSLPSNLQNKISKNSDVIEANIPSQSLPTGSGFITLQGGQKTNVAVVQSSLTSAQQKQLKLANGGVQISTVSGSFLIQKALVYDISFTTRFQGEWPNAWKAFMRNPILGQGFSTITLATDGEYFRILGESGILGFVSLFLVFAFVGSLFADKEKYLKDNLDRALVFGLAGGVIGILLNGTFIDVLEASKVAETMWLFLGIAASAVLIENKDKVDYKKYLIKIFTSNSLIFVYILVIAGIIFLPHVSNFFTADDFTWLKWAASSSSTHDVINYFINSQNFFYRPIDKALMYGLYAVLSFQPEGYRVVTYALNFLAAFGVYLILFKITKKKLISLLGSVIFLFNPSHGEDIYWISAISTTLSSVFIIFGLNYWINFRNKRNYIYYLVSFILFGLSLFSYEMSVMFILLVISYDLIFYTYKNNIKRSILEYLPLAALIPVYLFMRKFAHTVAPGGDYSYNLHHLIPNFFGNLFGYFTLGVFGEPSLPLYNLLRLSFKTQILPISLFLSLFIIILLAIFIIFRTRIHLKNNLLLFSLLFFIISLLPFIGLGNIAPRYDFLATFGISGIIVYIFMNIDKLSNKFKKDRINGLILILGMIIIYIYASLTNIENLEWQKAGEVTQNALIYLRENISNPVANSNFYFVNNPIRYKNAWILPLGLNDGMWFIYRDESIKSTNVPSLGQARLLKANNSNSYILEFDKNFNLKEVK